MSRCSAVAPSHLNLLIMSAASDGFVCTNIDLQTNRIELDP